MNKRTLLLPLTALLSFSLSACQDPKTPSDTLAAHGVWKTALTPEGQAVIDLTNELRTQGTLHGDAGVRQGTCAAQWQALPDLKPSGLLTYIASKHATYLALVQIDLHDEYQTSSPYFYGRDFSERLKRGFQDYGLGSPVINAAENVTINPETPEEAVLAWLRSPSHCSAMMDKELRYLGVGYVRGSVSTAWVQNFSE